MNKNWLEPEMSSPEYMRGFARRLKLAREGAGYQSARSFAHALGLKEPTYGRYERAEATPPYEVLREISRLTDRPLDYFI